MKTVSASARYQLISVILCCVGLQQIAQAQQFAPAVNYPAGRAPFSVAVGDFNQDGIPDLVVADAGGEAGTVRILLGNGDGTFRASREYSAGGTGASSVAVGDFNGDGKPDLAVQTNVGFGILLGNGDGTFMPVVEYISTGLAFGFVAVGDFNGDGKLDVVTVGRISDIDVVNIYLGKGDGTFALAESYPTGDFPESVSVADLNGDGRLDLAVANAGGSSVGGVVSYTISVLLGRGDGTFQAAVNYPVAPAPMGIASGDFNGDGKLDLVVASNGGGAGVLIGNGDGTFQAPVSYPAGDGPGSVAVGDFNTDGKLDLIVADFGGVDGTTVSLLLGNGDGTFQTAAPYIVGAVPISVAVADLNSDGLLDVAVANAQSDNVSVLLNAGQPCKAAPVIDHLRARPAALRPSGRLVDVFIDYEATSECGGPPACTLAVSSNEPLTPKDYRIIDAHHLKLRAEVSDREEREESDHRKRKHFDQLVYQIQVSCTDRLSNVAHGHTIVPVLEDHHGDDEDRHGDRDEAHDGDRDEGHRKHHDVDPASEKEEDSGSSR